MIERLRLRNFQCHDDLRIEFDPLVTTIVGPSDAGKSSIVRALRWIVENKPSGDAFVRSGEDRCSVLLWMDGQKIARRKGKGRNDMIVAGRKFEAFGADVPEPVADLLNLGRVNFGLQHDAPFWFSLTAGQVSRELNAVVNLDVIDETLAGVASALRKARSVEEVCRERLERARVQVKELEWVPAAVDDHESLERAGEELRRIERKASVLDGMISSAEEWRSKASAEIPDLSELERLKGESASVEEKRRELDRLVVRAADGFQDTITRVGKEVDELRREMDEEFGDVCPLCGSVMKREREGESR